MALNPSSWGWGSKLRSLAPETIHALVKKRALKRYIWLAKKARQHRGRYLGDRYFKFHHISDAEAFINECAIDKYSFTYSFIPHALTNSDKGIVVDLWQGCFSLSNDEILEVEMEARKY